MQCACVMQTLATTHNQEQKAAAVTQTDISSADSVVKPSAKTGSQAKPPTAAAKQQTDASFKDSVHKPSAKAVNEEKTAAAEQQTQHTPKDTICNPSAKAVDKEKTAAAEQQTQHTVKDTICNPSARAVSQEQRPAAEQRIGVRSSGNALKSSVVAVEKATAAKLSEVKSDDRPMKTSVSEGSQQQTSAAVQQAESKKAVNQEEALRAVEHARAMRQFQAAVDLKLEVMPWKCCKAALQCLCLSVGYSDAC